MITLEQSQQYCRQIVRESKSSFERAISILPLEQQQAMEALYAFMRTIDDIADDDNLSSEEKKERLLKIRDEVRSEKREARSENVLPHESVNSMSYSNSDDRFANLASRFSPLASPTAHFLPAFLHAVARFDIPESCVTDVIEGMLFDADFRPLKTVEELKWYCHCVAGTVGLACVKIWGLKQNDISVEHAWGRIASWIEQQAFAVQLTNILRDIKEDADRGRVYIPCDILHRYAWTPALFIEQVQRCNFKDGEATDMILDLVAMAEGNYLSSKLMHEYLSPLGKKSNRLIRCVYEAILQKVQRCPDLVLAHGVHLSRWEKIKLAFTQLLWKRN